MNEIESVIFEVPFKKNKKDKCDCCERPFEKSIPGAEIDTVTIDIRNFVATHGLDFSNPEERKLLSDEALLLEVKEWLNLELLPKPLNAQYTVIVEEVECLKVKEAVKTYIDHYIKILNREWIYAK